MCLLILVGFYQAEAQNKQATTPTEQGVLLTQLRYLYKPSGIVELNSTLCVINTSNEGPQWFLLSSDNWSMNIRIGSISAAMRLITDINASPDGKFLAVLSVGEGHPILEVVNLPVLLQEKQYQVLHELDPYPGFVEIRSWDGNRLHIDSDMLLTHRDKSSGRVPSELMLFWQETFSLNILTGKITGVSEGAKDPIEHYSKILMDQNASDAEKDEALFKMLRLNADNVSLKHLLNVLETERDPKRINKILEKIDKLRK